MIKILYIIYMLSFGGFGFKTVDEDLDTASLIVLLFLELQFEPLLFTARFLESIIAASVKGQLAAIEMQNVINGAIEKIAVVANDDDRVGVIAQMAL